MTVTNRKLLDFIDRSPTAWHACANLISRLREEDYTELRETEPWEFHPGGKYYVCRNGSSMIAFRVPEGEFPGFLMMAAHVDSPLFRLRGNPDSPSAGVYTRLSVERYGSMLCAPWLDRPLSVAGRVTVREGGKLVTKLVNIEHDLALIPNLAIHMDRTANDGKKYDIKVDMLPLFGSEKAAGRMEAIAAEAAGVAPEDLVSSDLYLYPRTPGVCFGADEEYIAAPRLDDLQCAFGCLEGFLAAQPGKNAPLLCLFDNEEVGSTTKQGANSDFLVDVLWRICEALGRDFYRSVSASFMASADNAHAIHPNHPEYADSQDRPVINGGIVIKHHANQKYTTDAVSEAVFAEICRRAGVPVQHYSNRADLRGGTTLGNISTSHVSVDSVDIGLAQLAMHSCYETAGAADTDYLIRAARAYYESGFQRTAEGIEL
jgi:aspartyl aminopeptidase